MRTLTNTSIEVWAFPQRNFIQSSTRFKFPVSDYAGRLFLDESNTWPIEVCEVLPGEIPRPIVSARVGPNTDFSSGVKFKVMLDRRLIEHFVQKAVEKHPILSNRAFGRGKDDRALGVAFNGLLIRSFHPKILLLLAAANISSPLCFPVSTLRYFSYGKETVGEQFLVTSRQRSGVQRSVKCGQVDNLAFFQFVSGQGDELYQAPKSQFSMAFSLLSHSISTNQNSPIEALVWAIASIEAMLGEKDRSSRRLVETRILALLPDLIGSDVVHMFRKLYDLRSGVLHGGASIPMPFSINTIGSSADPIDEISFSQYLAMKMLHRYFELNRTNVSFSTSLA